MKKLLALILVWSSISQLSSATNFKLGGDTITNPDQLWQYKVNDRFQWTNTDDQVHILAGFTISFVTSYTLERYADLSPLEAGLAGFAAGALVGVVKETFIDSYTSRTDIKCWGGGALIGTMTFTVLHF